MPPSLFLELYKIKKEMSNGLAYGLLAKLKPHPFSAGDEARLHFLSQAKENYEPTIGTLFI